MMLKLWYIICSLFFGMLKVVPLSILLLIDRNIVSDWLNFKVFNKFGLDGNFIFWVIVIATFAISIVAGMLKYEKNHQVNVKK